MKIAIDVQYTNNGAYAAGLVFQEWEDEHPLKLCASHIPVAEEYVPGTFYKRELPCIMQLLSEHQVQPDCIVIDGYVYLDGLAQVGLGKHLFDALGGKTSIIGVAKSSFSSIDGRFSICRGGSQKPLFITSIGVDIAIAQAQILSMHGKHRLPSLLKQVDQLCRKAASSAPVIPASEHQGESLGGMVTNTA